MWHLWLRFEKQTWNIHDLVFATVSGIQFKKKYSGKSWSIISTLFKSEIVYRHPSIWLNSLTYYQTPWVADGWSWSQGPITEHNCLYAIWVFWPSDLFLTQSLHVLQLKTPKVKDTTYCKAMPRSISLEVCYIRKLLKVCQILGMFNALACCLPHKGNSWEFHKH